MAIPDSVTSPAMRQILCVLEKKSNLSVSDISAQAFVGVTTLACGDYLKTMKAQQRIYVSGWRKANGRFSTPLYSFGHQPDVARPKIDDSCRDAPGMRRILETLERYGHLNYHDIARFPGLSPNTVKNSGYLSALIAQQRIHIGSWQRSRGGPMLPIYHAGAGVSVQKPPSITATEKSRNHRERERMAERGRGIGTLLAEFSR